MPLGRPVSRLVLGTMLVADDVLDEWVRLGGNILDTAHVYGDGDSERALGAWFATNPKEREELIVLTKGAHGTTTLSLISYETFQTNRILGLGSALAVLTFLIVMIVSFVYIRFVGGNIRGLAED